MFDVISFLESRGVHYVEKGSNVAKGNVNIKCPWCGLADRSEHLGINLETGAWGCWRSTAHRSRDLAVLVAKVDNIGLRKARQLVGQHARRVGDSELFSQIISGQYFKPQEGERVVMIRKRFRKVELPEGTKSFYKPKPKRDPELRYSARRFVQYLLQRGFRKSHIRTLVHDHRVRYNIGYSRKWKERLILPVTYEGNIVTYTSRSIIPGVKLRYRTASQEDEALPINDTLYNYDRAMLGGKVLFVVEGPLDALKLDIYGAAHDCTAVAVYTVGTSEKQRMRIRQLAQLWDTVCVLFDAKFETESQRLADALSTVPNMTWSSCSYYDADDPGEMTSSQVRDLCVDTAEGM